MSNRFGISDDVIEAVRKVLAGEKMDPVGKADADIDNDGDVDKSDSYLHNRRKAIKKAMKKEEVEVYEAKMSASQIAALKKAYEPMRGKKISMDSGNKLRSIMDKIDDDKQALIRLVKADIPFVSALAVTRLISKHDMKGAEINKLKEEVEQATEEVKKTAPFSKPYKKVGDRKDEYGNVVKNAAKYLAKKAMKKQMAKEDIEQTDEGAMSRMDVQTKEKERLGSDKVKGGGLKTFKKKYEVDVKPKMAEASELPKKVIMKGHEIAKKLIKMKSKVDEPYAVGMDTAKKKYGID
jgi:hypothetical protein